MDPTCVACSAPLGGADRFCEQCGAAVNRPAMPPAAGCRRCGAPTEAVGEDGYCTVCGVRARPPPARDELDLGSAAAVSEQGRTHRRNEDAFHLALAGEHQAVAVVCDGISTALSGDLAARVAADAAAAALIAAVRNGATPEALADATHAAVQAAGDAVQQLPWTTRSDLALPSCTLVSAVVSDGAIVVGWVGDSRAYWLAAGAERQLTIDDSWATEQVVEGLLSPEQAAADRRAHAITRWVGADDHGDGPRVTTLRPDLPGRLVLCSDGLWNYAPKPSDLAALLEPLGPSAAPAAAAGALAAAAMERGGRDDVTVAVIDVQLQRGPQP